MKEPAFAGSFMYYQIGNLEMEYTESNDRLDSWVHSLVIEREIR